MSSTRINPVRWLLLIAMASCLVACGEEGTAEPRLRNLVFCENPDVGAPSCSLPGYEVGDDAALAGKLANCAQSGCHGESGVSLWTLDLSGDVQSALAPLTTILGVNGDYLVDGFDPDCSYLLTKVTDQPSGGSRMPLTPPYWTDAEVGCFRAYLHELYPSVSE